MSMCRFSTSKLINGWQSSQFPCHHTAFIIIACHHSFLQQSSQYLGHNTFLSSHHNPLSLYLPAAVIVIPCHHGFLHQPSQFLLSLQLLQQSSQFSCHGIFILTLNQQLHPLLSVSDAELISPEDRLSSHYSPILQ